MNHHWPVFKAKVWGYFTRSFDVFVRNCRRWAHRERRGMQGPGNRNDISVSWQQKVPTVQTKGLQLLLNVSKTCMFGPIWDSKLPLGLSMRLNTSILWVLRTHMIPLVQNRWENWWIIKSVCLFSLFQYQVWSNGSHTVSPSFWVLRIDTWFSFAEIW